MADLFTRPTAPAGTRQMYTVPLSILAHVLGVSVLLVVPLVASTIFPLLKSVPAYAVPSPPRPPEPELRPAAVPPPSSPAEIDVNRNASPTEAPAGFTPEPPPATLTHVAVGPAIATGRTVTLEAPPPAAPSAPIRVGGDIKPPVRVKYVAPVYPMIARAARVSGTVQLEAIIAKDGSVKNLRVMRTAGVLDQAAIDAVSQWRYSPTTLNGEPVEVIMAVTVSFALN